MLFQDEQFEMLKIKEKIYKSKADYNYAMYKSEEKKGNKAAAMNYYEMSQEYYAIWKEYSEITAAYQDLSLDYLEKK
jgi:hypothetical protein